MISAEELTMLSDRAVGRLLPKIALLEADVGPWATEISIEQGCGSVL